MEEYLLGMLDKEHYVRFKYADEEACMLFPILYYTEENFVLYNKCGLEIQKDKSVFLSISDDTFEFVIKGNIQNSDRNINVQILSIEKHRNRRKNQRFDLNLEAELIVDGKQNSGKIVNISDSGALIIIDDEPEGNVNVDFLLADKMIYSKIVREGIRNNKRYFGVRFEENKDILITLKKIPSFDADRFNDVSIFVVLDEFSDVTNYKNIFEKRISVNFININSGCESFIIDYIQNKRTELILLDMEKEENVIPTIQKFMNYMDAQKKIIVLIHDQYGDELLKELGALEIGFVLKPFIGEEIKGILLEMG